MTNNNDDSMAEETEALLNKLGNGRIVSLDGEAGRSILEFTCDPTMCHSGGVAQGGFVTGWVDAAMAHACLAQNSSGFWIATLELKISFYRPVPPGPVVATGWIERAGKQTVFAEGEVADVDGTVLAKATSTIRLVPTRA